MSRREHLARTLRAWDQGELDDLEAADRFLAIIEEPVIATQDEVLPFAAPTWQMTDRVLWMRSVIYPAGGLTPVWYEWHVYSGRFDSVGVGSIQFTPSCGRRASEARPRVQSPSSRVEFAMSPDSREAICGKCLGLVRGKPVAYVGFQG